MPIGMDQVYEAIRAFGIGGVFALMWWLERQERLRLQQLLEGFLPTATNAIKSFNRVLGVEEQK